MPAHENPPAHHGAPAGPLPSGFVLMPGRGAVCSSALVKLTAAPFSVWISWMSVRHGRWALLPTSDRYR